MKSTMILCVTALLFIAALPAEAGPKPKPKTPTASSPAPNATTAERSMLTADSAYKSNCMRCHGEPRKFSERAMKTIMRHMRVRANLTDEETQLILEYLTK